MKKNLILITVIFLVCASKSSTGQDCFATSNDPKYLFPAASFPPGINIFLYHDINKDNPLNSAVTIRENPYKNFSMQSTTQGLPVSGPAPQFHDFSGNDMEAPADKMFHWAMMSNDATCTYDYKMLPPGIVFGLHHTTNNPTMLICNSTAMDCSSSSNIIGGLREVCGFDFGSSAGQGLKWFETTGDNFSFNNFSEQQIIDLLKKFPKTLIIGLVHTNNHPTDPLLDKWSEKFLASGKKYNASDPSGPVPPGFERVFGGDFDTPGPNKEKRGYWWFQSIVGADPIVNSFICIGIGIPVGKPNDALIFPTVLPTFCSASKSYGLRGYNLTDDIIVTPPKGFEVSISDVGTAYSENPITIPREVSSDGLGRVNETIFVRFCPKDPTLFSDNISNASNGAFTQNVPVNGAGFETSPLKVKLQKTNPNSNINCYSAMQVKDVSNHIIKWNRVIKLQNKSGHDLRLANICAGGGTPPNINLNDCGSPLFFDFPNNSEINACVYFNNFKCGKQSQLDIYAYLKNGSLATDVKELEIQVWVYPEGSEMKCW